MKHCCIMLSCAPNQPNTFRAICGHESTDANEFIKITNPTIKGVTCPKCLENLRRSTLIVKTEDT